MKLNVLKVAVALTVFALLLTACGGPTLKVLSKDEAKGYYDQLMAVKDSEPFAIIKVLEGLSGDECLDRLRRVHRQSHRHRRARTVHLDWRPERAICQRRAADLHRDRQRQL